MCIARCSAGCNAGCKAGCSAGSVEDRAENLPGAGTVELVTVVKILPRFHAFHPFHTFIDPRRRLCGVRNSSAHSK